MTNPSSPVDDQPVTDAVDGAAVPHVEEPSTDPRDEAAAGDTPDWDALAEDDVRSRGELLAELTEAEARRDEYLDGLQRARAEFDNFRKRTLRDGATQRTHGQADVVARLLDVLDDFDRTLDAIANGDEGIITGVTLVHDKLAKTLADVGLARIDQVGVVFDPTEHEAVQQRPADEPMDAPRVVEIFRTGYRLGDRVLRPAMVVVEQ